MLVYCVYLGFPLCPFLITSFPLHQFSVVKNKSIYLNWLKSTDEGRKEQSERRSLSPVNQSLASFTQAPSGMILALHGHLSEMVSLFEVLYELQVTTFTLFI